MALSPGRQIARMSKIKNDGLYQYGTEPFEPQQFGTAGIEWVKRHVRYVFMTVKPWLHVKIKIQLFAMVPIPNNQNYAVMGRVASSLKFHSDLRSSRVGSVLQSGSGWVGSRKLDPRPSLS